MNNTTSDAQDQADMIRLAAGHEAALNDLMTRHAQPLFHYLIRLLQNETEAADLAEETFVRVYLNRHRFDPKRKFATWLYTIATRLARDRFRWLSRHQLVSLDSPNDPHAALKDVLTTGQPTPPECLDARERAAAVRRALAQLPEELRIPLVLSEYENQSHAEIAATLNCSVKAVEMRLYRARQQLRSRLAPLLAPVAWP